MPAMTSQARIIFGASANGQETGPGVFGTLQIGTSQQTVNFPDADICYCVGAQLAAIDDYVSVIPATGIATGSGAIIEDGDGKDFQGVDLTAMTKLYAVLVEVTEGAAKISGDTMNNIPAPCLLWNPAGLPSENVDTATTVTATSASTEVFLTIIGKS